MITVEEARQLGHERGLHAASWVFDGNTPIEMYRRVLKGIRTGDPEILDSFGNDWMKGGVASLIIGTETETVDAYCEAADQAFWDEVEGVAQHHVNDEEVAGMIKFSITITFLANTPDMARCFWEMLDTCGGTATYMGYAHDVVVIDPKEEG